MTALAAPPTLSKSRAHPVPWMPMARVTWLERRSALIGLLVLYVGCAIAIVVGEQGVHGSYASFVAGGCVANAFHVPCGTIENMFEGSQDAFSAIVIALNVLPAAVGVFIGAPLLSREFESGTFRFTWTQAVGRTRYVATTLALLAGLVVTAAVLLGLLLSTWAHPFQLMGTESEWYSGLFATTWFMLAAWSLFALTLGVWLGAAIRRTVSAMAVAAVAIGGLSIASFVLFVHRLLAIAPLASRRISPLSGLGIGVLNEPANRGTGQPLGAWLVRDWFTGPDGHVLSANTADNLRNLLYGGQNGRSVNVTTWLATHHDAFWVSYQPASRFWIFQGVAGVILIVLAVAFAVVTLRLITERGGRGQRV